MTRLISVRAGRGRVDLFRSFTDGRGPTDTASSALTLGGGAFNLGMTKPDASNAGVPAGTVLTPFVGNLTASTAGVTYTAREFFGWVNVTAPNVTFVNCKFRGNQSTSYSNSGNVVWSQSTGLVLDRCTIRPDYPTWWLEGIYGGGYTLHRCDVSGTVDGCLVRSGSTTITGNYFHDFFFSDQSGDQGQTGPPWLSSSKIPPYWTHNDGIQFRVASGSGPHLVRGNNFQWYPDENVPNGLSRNAVLEVGWDSTTGQFSYYNKSFVSPYSGRYLWGSAITASPDLGPITGVTATENWFEGGTACFQMSTVNPAGTAMNFGELSYNRVGADQFNYSTLPTVGKYQIRYKSIAVVALVTTNYWDAVGSVAPVKWGVNLSVGTSVSGNGIVLDP
jgi:hypothetical protein